MKAYGEVEVYLHSFFYLGAVGGEWSVSRPDRLTSRERDPGTHWIGGWVGPRAVLDAVVKRKLPSPHRESNPRTPIVQPVAQRYINTLFSKTFSLMFLPQSEKPPIEYNWQNYSSYQKDISNKNVDFNQD
jgi:hypothetical protein